MSTRPRYVAVRHLGIEAVVDLDDNRTLSAEEIVSRLNRYESMLRDQAWEEIARREAKGARTTPPPPLPPRKYGIDV